VTSVLLPALAFWTAVVPMHGKLVVSGPLHRGGQCGYVTVDPASLRSSAVTRACASDRVHVVFDRRSQWAKAFVGRTLAFRYEDSSTGRPVSAASGDALWLYDVDTDRGPIIQRWSRRTGRLEQELRFPVRLFRPVLAANADGAWLMAAVNGGEPGPTQSLYRVTTRVTVVQRGPARAAMWMTTHGRTLWLETVTGTQSFRLWRYDGTHGRVLWTRHSPSLMNTVFGGGSAYGGGALWGIAAPYCAKTLRVLRIDGRTGAIQTVARTPLLDCDQYGAGAFYRGSFWFVDGNRLFRAP
jgi:hypothetical protein